MTFPTVSDVWDGTGFCDECEVELQKGIDEIFKEDGETRCYTCYVYRHWDQAEEVDSVGAE